MNTAQKIAHTLFSPALALLMGAQLAHADSVGQVQTTKYFAPETVAMIKQRVLDVANHVPGATLGFKTGDTVSYIIQFTPIANGANIGAGGYITDYIPPGTQVTSAAFVQPDGFGGFYQTTPPAPAQMANGFGSGGAGAYTATWTSDPYTISTCASAGLTLATCTGNLAQLYADTGIFYSTDPRTQVFTDPSTDGRVRQWGATTGGNGYYVNSTRNTQLVPVMGGTTGVTLPTTHNLWDAAMSDAFGTNVLPVNTPNSGIAKIDTNGAGLAPFNAGSPVAGPNTGYQLDYTGNVGPWQRISYPGSTIGSNAFSATNPAIAAGTSAVLATSTMSGASFPLPPTTNAVRWAAGRLVVGTQNYVKISLLLTSTPPSGGLVNNSEVFGGDASPESTGPGFGNRDSAWVYHVPSVASNVSTLYVLKEVICVYDATNTCIPNNGANLPTTGTPATVGPKVRYRITYINTNNGTQHNVVICDQLPTTTPAITFATDVSQISASPYIGVPASPAAASCGFGAGGTTFSYPTIPVMAGGAAGVLEYDVQFPVLTAGTSISNTAKAVSTEIPSGVTSVTPSNVVASLAADLRISKSNSLSAANKGDTVSYTVTVTNAGSSSASITTLVDTLPGVATAVVASQIPSRFNYVATGTITINGSPLSGVTATVTPPAAPGTTNSETVTWTFPSGTTIPAGGQLMLTFTTTVGDSTANNLMVYGTAYSNTATINCSANCVTTPAAAATKSTGAVAPVTLTVPNLQVTKTIDCVFSGATCTAGSYTIGDNIPPSAKLRYKIVYANPTVSAQTITLSDTLPASTTAAGNLYVASGPDIRPSTPVLSVNPAAAGAVRGVDAAPTTIAPGSVVNFTSVSLAGNSSGTLYIDVQTNVAAAAVVTNTGSIQSAQRLAAGGTAVTSAASATAAALIISKSASSATVAPGGTVNYTITVTNPGVAAVTLTTLVDTLPKPLPNLAGRTIQCGVSVATCVATVSLNGAAPATAPVLTQTAATAAVGQINTWTFAAGSNTINAGATLTLTFTATFSSTVLNGNTYSNTATINYTGGTSTTGLVAPVSVPYNTLSVSKTVITPASASIAPNSAVTYAITVTNTGAIPAPVTSVVDSLPAASASTIAYTSTASVLVNGIAQTAVASPTLPVGAQYQSPAPAAAAPNVQQAITWTFPAAGTTTINPGQTMVITFVAQYGAIPTGSSYYNDVMVNYSGGLTPNVAGQNLAPVAVPAISKITKTIDCIYNPTCVAGSYVDGTPIPVNAKLGYKIVYQNLSALPASGITITDILPTQTAANSISNLIVNGIATAAPASAAGGATVTLLSGGTLTASATGTLTFDVQTTATVGAGVTNTGKMTSTQDPVGVSSFAIAATDGANLSVSKAVTSGTSSTVAQGGVVSYTITVSNNGSSAATLNTLVDTLPGVAATAPGTTSRFTYTATGTINLNGLTIAPAYTAAVTPPAAPATTNKEVVTWTFTSGVSIPAGQTLTLTFTATVGTAVPKGTAAPGATYYNDVIANYSGGLYPSASANNQAAVLVPFNTLTMTKTIDCVYDTQTVPVCQPYTAGNPIPPNAKLRYKLLYTNTSPVAQTVTIKDTLPASTTAAGNLYVGNGPELRPSTPAISQNSATAGAARGADVALTAIAAGSTVAMTAVNLPGNSSGSLYIDVQTNVAASTSVSNCASISTVAADTCATLGVVSSTATALAQNVAVLNISKTTSTPNVIPGGTATYTISITNTGTAATSTLKVYDFLPFSGTTADATKRLAYVASSSSYTGGLPVPTITTSIAPTIAPYASNLNQQQVSWDFGNFALAVGGTVTITFNATVGTAMPEASYYNSVRQEYTSAGVSFNGNFNNTALITVNNPTPSMLFLKTVTIYSDPVNGTTNPKFIPGALAQYTLSVVNSGTGPADNNTTAITDPIPANTALFVNDLGGTPAGPVSFTQGTPSSTLTYTFTALNSTTDDVSFSNDNGATWAYVPVPGADGCDPLVTHLRINPKGSFVGSPVIPSPSFSLNFRVCVK